MRQTFSMYLAVRAMEGVNIDIFPLNCLDRSVWVVSGVSLTLLDGGIGDSITVTRVTVILEIARDDNTIGLELRQGIVAKVQRQRLPASPAVIYDPYNQSVFQICVYSSGYRQEYDQPTSQKTDSKFLGPSGRDD